LPTQFLLVSFNALSALQAKTQTLKKNPLHHIEQTKINATIAVFYLFKRFDKIY